jgi:hypothetical protein
MSLEANSALVKKFPLRNSKPSNNSITTTKTTPKTQALHQRRLQQGNGAQTPSSPDQKIIGFQPGDSHGAGEMDVLLFFINHVKSEWQDKRNSQ